MCRRDHPRDNTFSGFYFGIAALLSDNGLVTFTKPCGWEGRNRFPVIKTFTTEAIYYCSRRQQLKEKENDNLAYFALKSCGAFSKRFRRVEVTTRPFTWSGMV